MPAASDATSPAPAPTLLQRAAALAINGLLFELLYTACNLAAARAGVTRDVAFAWDAGVPFVPWTLLPYMSSVPMLVLGFLAVPDRQGLRALSQRAMLATVLATLAFAVWPLRVTWTRPVPDVPLLAVLNEALGRLDAPYNQWPSLHVAYCVILWPALASRLRSGAARFALAGWLSLVAASTVLTHQHHLADLAGGALLGGLVVRWVPARRDEPWVALHYAVLALAALTLGLTVAPLLPALWIAACCAAVARAYAFADTGFLRKRGGAFPGWVRVLYGPYIAGYRVTWWLVRRRERGRPAFAAFGDGLWVGRRLDEREAQALPAGCAVIDLASELSQTPALRARPGASFGLLDLVTPTPAGMAAILDAIDAQHASGRPVYLHCAMGYRRSLEVARAWQARHAEPEPG